jgi:hypothetical protein
MIDPAGAPNQATSTKAMSKHTRNVADMVTSKRCEAKTRGGPPCKCPAVRGRARCRMHGGARGSGAPKGNQYAFKHGAYSAEAIEERKELHQLLKRSRQGLSEIFDD